MLFFAKEEGVIGGDSINQFLQFRIPVRRLEQFAILIIVIQYQGAQSFAEARMDDVLLASMLIRVCS